MIKFNSLWARLSAVVGLFGIVTYLTWRAASSWTTVPMWLWVPAFACEVAGFAGSTLLIWALWLKPRVPAVDRRSMALGRQNGDESAEVIDAADAVDAIDVADMVDVVVRVTGQSPADLRATILAAVSMHQVGRLFVVDLTPCAARAEVATELGAHYVECDSYDLNGLQHALDSVTSSAFVLLDAGDVPSRNLVTTLVPRFDDPTVAVVQGIATAPAIDSPEHGANGVHELHFERSTLNPALGARGSAMWLGSGSLVRRAALESVTIGNQHPLPAQWAISGALHASKWRIESPAGPPLVSVQPLLTPDAVYDDRVRRARSARRLLVGPHGALGLNRLTLRRRAALLAWTVRPLSGLVRGVFIGVLVGSLLSGKLPLQLAPAALLWAPAFFGSVLAVTALSRGSLRLGDRTRWSLMTLGAAYRGLSSPPVLPSGLQPLISFRTARHGSALVGSVVVVSTVMALRGLSDRVSHTLHPIDQAQLVALMGVALWLLTLSLDAMRLLARRGRMRRAFRVVSSLPAQFGDRSAFVVDLTAHGAGLVSDHALAVGDSAAFEMVLTTGSGCTTAMVAATVRNVSERPYGGWRIGIEFLAPAGATADALAEHCVIEPARLAMGEIGAPSDVLGRQLVDDVEGSSSEEGRRALLRLAAAIALVGAAASVAPQSAAASSPSHHLVRGSVLVGNRAASESDGDGLGGVTVMAVCSLDQGADEIFGTADDSYGPTSSTSTNSDGSFDLALDGEACWTSIVPPVGYAHDPVEAGELVVEPSAPTSTVPETVPSTVPATVPVTLPSQPVQSDDVPAVPGSNQSPNVQPIDLGSAVTQQVILVALSTPAQPAGTDDVVWSDLDGNGLRDQAEPGLSGVLVTMYDASGSVHASTRTNPQGEYHFASMLPGLYSVGVSSLPEGAAVSDAKVLGTAGVRIDPATGRSALLPVTKDAVSIGVSVGIAPAASHAAPASPHRLLPAPSDGMTSGRTDSSVTSVASPLALLLLVLAAGLAGSLVLCYAVSRQRWRSQSSVMDGEEESSSLSPDLAMR